MSLVPWIKIEHTLPDKPEVIRIAAELRIDQDAVTGKLLRLWIWADQNTVDGESMTITEAFIDRLTGQKKFAKAMRTAGWLEGADGALTFPGFHRHNGETAKGRAETNRRVANHRQRNRKGVTDVTQEPLPKALQKPLPEEEEEEEELRALRALARRAAHLVPKINSLRPGVWRSPKLNAAEEREAIANLEVLEAIDDESWKVMARYLAAKHPEGSGAWLVQIRLKFLETPNDLESRALSWAEKQKDRKPPPPPAPVTERVIIPREETAALLSLDPKSLTNPAA